LDVLTLAVAFLAAYTLRTHLKIFIPVQPLTEYIWLIGAWILLSIIIFFSQGLYRDVRDLSMLEEYAKILKGLTYAFVLVLALTFFLKLYERSRVLILLYWIISAGFMIATRFAFYHAIWSLRAKGWNRRNVAIVGSEKKIRSVAQLLRQNKRLGYHVVTELALPRGISPHSPQARKELDHAILARYQRGEINAVIVSDTIKNYQHIIELHEVLQEYGISHRDVSEAFDLTGLKSPGGEGIEALLTNLDEGQINGAYKVAKRVLDESASVCTLILTLPLWLVIMALIKLDSQGPVFFRQERVGYLGKKFKIYKFRSMHVEAPKYAKTPRHRQDPRITRVGAFLRRTSLDELPQLINVAKGEMSLVGPRPEMPFIVEKYKSIYRYRFLVKPGLTGLWQVSGRTDKPLEDNIKYDLYYIKKQSLLLDLIIILRTLPAVFLGKGAY